MALLDARRLVTQRLRRTTAAPRGRRRTSSTAPPSTIVAARASMRAIELCPLEGQADHQRGMVVAGLPQIVAARPAASPSHVDDLQGPHHPAGVARIDGRRGAGSRRPVQRAAPPGLQPLPRSPERCRTAGSTAGRHGQGRQRRPHVEAGPADHQRPARARPGRRPPEGGPARRTPRPRRPLRWRRCIPTKA